MNATSTSNGMKISERGRVTKFANDLWVNMEIWSLLICAALDTIQMTYGPKNLKFKIQKKEKREKLYIYIQEEGGWEGKVYIKYRHKIILSYNIRCKCMHKMKKNKTFATLSATCQI